MSDTSNTPETPDPTTRQTATQQPAQDAATAKAEADKARQAGDELAALKAESRKWEAQAKANADAAKRLAEIEEASKTEAQKQAEALAASQAKVAEYEHREQVETWKTEVATAAADIPADRRAQFRSLLAGSTEEEIKVHAEKLKSLFVGSGQAPAGPQPIPGEGQPTPLALNGDGIEAALKSAVGMK